MGNKIVFECTVERVYRSNYGRKRIYVSSKKEFESSEWSKTRKRYYGFVYGFDLPTVEYLKIKLICDVNKAEEKTYLNCMEWTFLKPTNLIECKAFLFATLGKEKLMSPTKITALLNKWNSLAVEAFQNNHVESLFFMFCPEGSSSENADKINEAIKAFKQKYDTSEFDKRVEMIRSYSEDNTYETNPTFNSQFENKNVPNPNSSVGVDDLIPIEEEDIGSAVQAIVCFCLDTSYSMQGRKIKTLNEVVNNFIAKNREDVFNANMLNLSIVAFGGLEAKTIQEFANIRKVNKQEFVAGGKTHMSDGVEKAINLILNEKQRLNEIGVSTYKPILIIMSDGQPNESIDNVSKRLKELICNKKINVYCVAYNSDADNEQDKKDAFATLQTLTNKKVETANEFSVEELFLKLSRSISNMSRSFAGDIEDLL